MRLSLAKYMDVWPRESTPSQAMNEVMCVKFWSALAVLSKREPATLHHEPLTPKADDGGSGLSGTTLRTERSGGRRFHRAAVDHPYLARCQNTNYKSGKIPTSSGIKDSRQRFFQLAAICHALGCSALRQVVQLAPHSRQLGRMRKADQAEVRLFAFY